VDGQTICNGGYRIHVKHTKKEIRILNPSTCIRRLWQIQSLSEFTASWSKEMWYCYAHHFIDSWNVSSTTCTDSAHHSVISLPGDAGLLSSAGNNSAPKRRSYCVSGT